MSHHILRQIRGSLCPWTKSFAHINTLELLLILSSWRNFATTAPVMEIHHFNEGSPKPEVKNGEITLFSMRFCPYAHRAHLVLNAKNKTYDAIFINLESKPKWYTDIFPAGRVPALRYKGEILYESLLLADFLNEEFPEISLYSSDPVLKLKDKMLIEKFSQVSSAFYKVAMVAFNEENVNNLISGVSDFEQELAKRNTKYFGGNERPMMIDYMIWPWFERIQALPHLYGEEARLLTEKFPHLGKWIALMETDPSVLKHYLTPEQHAKHFRLRKAKDPGAFDGVY